MHQISLLAARAALGIAMVFVCETVASAQAQTPEANRTTWIVPKSVNVRDKPDATAVVVGGALARQSFRIISEVGDWYQIELSDGKRGFVAKSVTSIKPPAPILVPDEPKPPLDSANASVPSPDANQAIRKPEQEAQSGAPGRIGGESMPTSGPTVERSNNTWLWFIGGAVAAIAFGAINFVAFYFIRRRQRGVTNTDVGGDLAEGIVRSVQALTLERTALEVGPESDLHRSLLEWCHGKQLSAVRNRTPGGTLDSSADLLAAVGVADVKTQEVGSLIRAGLAARQLYESIPRQSQAPAPSHSGSSETGARIRRFFIRIKVLRREGPKVATFAPTNYPEYTLRPTRDEGFEEWLFRLATELPAYAGALAGLRSEVQKLQSDTAQSSTEASRRQQAEQSLRDEIGRLKSTENEVRQQRDKLQHSLLQSEDRANGLQKSLEGEQLHRAQVNEQLGAAKTHSDEQRQRIRQLDQDLAALREASDASIRNNKALANAIEDCKRVGSLADVCQTAQNVYYEKHGRPDSTAALVALNCHSLVHLLLATLDGDDIRRAAMLRNLRAIAEAHSHYRGFEQVGRRVAEIEPTDDRTFDVAEGHVSSALFPMLLRLLREAEPTTPLRSFFFDAAKGKVYQASL